MHKYQALFDRAKNRKIVTPRQSEIPLEEFRAALKRVLETHAETLKNLAKR
jgi:hypothetical protein